MNRREMMAGTVAALIGAPVVAAPRRDHLIPQAIHVKESGGRVRNVPRGDGGRAFGVAMARLALGCMTSCWRSP